MRSLIGVAGCGRMGGPMLAALRAADLPARGYDVVPSEMGHITDDIAVFSEDLDTLITVVRDIDQTDAVLFGDQNFTAIPSLRRIAMGKHFHHMGAYGAGMQAKVLNNLLAASNTAMTRLVLDWADQSGLDEGKLLNLIHTSSGQNWLASGFNDIEFARDGFAPDNTIGILVKDVASALDAAPSDADTALPELIQTAIKNLKPRP